MKEEVKRILKLVQDGKLSAEDASELIEAFEASEGEQPRADTGATHAPPPPSEPREDPSAPPPGPHSSPPPFTQDAFRESFRSLVDSMEKFGREATDSVNWTEVGRQAKESAHKGVEAMKSGIEQLSKGKFNVSFFGAQDVKEITLPLTVPECKLLKIDNPCGDIKVVGGFDVGSVSARAKFRGASYEDANAKAAAYTLIVEESEAAVLIRQPDVSGLEVDIEVQLAGLGAVEIKSASGDISVTETGAACRVSSRSGDVKLRGLDGLIEVQTTSGDLSVEDSSTPSLSVEIRSGDISLKRVLGSINAKTASGDVSLHECGGKVISLESVSGDVTVDLIEPVTGTLNVRTVSGDAKLSIPDGSDCRVSASTMRGDVNCMIELTEESRSEQHAKGRIGDGTGTIDISAVNGDISLEQRRHATV